MIDYTLAKKLKDAGFSQKDTLTRQIVGGKPKILKFPTKDKIVSFKATQTEKAYIPTLEELIDACGEKKQFFTITYFPSRKLWYAENGQRQGIGKTLSEAVANLWLALREQKEKEKK